MSGPPNWIGYAGLGKAVNTRTSGGTGTTSMTDIEFVAVAVTRLVDALMLEHEGKKPAPGLRKYGNELRFLSHLLHQLEAVRRALPAPPE